MDDKLYCKDPSLARQASKDEVDINQVLAKYANGGVLNVNVKEPIYADVSQLPDYRTALETVRDAESAFAELPSYVRDRFSNDPGELLAFLSNVDNRDEALELGLIEPDKAPVVTTPAPPAP